MSSSWMISPVLLMREPGFNRGFKAFVPQIFADRLKLRVGFYVKNGRTVYSLVELSSTDRQLRKQELTIWNTQQHAVCMHRM